VNLPASVEGRERLRLFCALRLPDDVVEQLVGWQRDAIPEREGLRRLRPEQLHVTLAFLGHRPASDVPVVVEALQDACSRASLPSLAPRRYRETRSVGMIVLDDAGDRATRLAERLHKRLERARVYEREKRRWLPHLTVARFRTPPRLRLEPPGLGVFEPSDAAVYHSLLRPGGAQYEVLHTVALGR
jgi:RNA 2',3'-cyclic 3'-phosphodiesterase